MRATPKAYLLGICRFLLLWYGSLILGAALIRFATHFTLAEIRDFAAAHRKAVVILCCVPFPFIAICTVAEW